MRFSNALSHFENGLLIARSRWNRDVKEDDVAGLSFVFLNKSNESSRVPEALVNTGQYDPDSITTVLQHPMKKNRANLFSIWLPTVEDMCAKDWYVVDLSKQDWNIVCGNFRRHVAKPDPESDENNVEQ